MQLLRGRCGFDSRREYHFSPGMLAHTRSLLYSRRGRRNNVTRLRLAANNRCSVAALLTIPAGSTIFRRVCLRIPDFLCKRPTIFEGRLHDTYPPAMPVDMYLSRNIQEKQYQNRGCKKLPLIAERPSSRGSFHRQVIRRFYTKTRARHAKPPPDTEKHLRVRRCLPLLCLFFIFDRLFDGKEELV